MEVTTMVKKLIVNADDFGISEGAVLGIIAAYQQGILTSTTCMMNMPYTDMAISLAKQHPQLGLGIHLVLTLGKPLTSNCKSFIDENGNFLRPEVYENEEVVVDSEELYQEWKAQIEKFIKLMGKKPTHIDSHHHVHLLPQLQQTVIKLANEYDLPIRQRLPITSNYQFVHCNDQFYNQKATYDYFISVLNSDDEYLEIMCHPAFLDWRLYNISSYNILRMKELDLLCDQRIKHFIDEHQIELINFSKIKKISS